MHCLMKSLKMSMIQRCGWSWRRFIFLMWYLGAQVITISLCESTRFGYISFKAACGLSAHVCGFAAKGMWNTLMQADPFNDNPGMAFVSLLIAMAGLALACVSCLGIRRLIIYPKMRPEQAEKCREEICEVENDMVSLSTGFLISQVIRF